MEQLKGESFQELLSASAFYPSRLFHFAVIHYSPRSPHTRGIGKLLSHGRICVEILSFLLCFPVIVAFPKGRAQWNFDRRSRFWRTEARTLHVLVRLLSSQKRNWVKRYNLVPIGPISWIFVTEPTITDSGACGGSCAWARGCRLPSLVHNFDSVRTTTVSGEENSHAVTH